MLKKSIEDAHDRAPLLKEEEHTSAKQTRQRRWREVAVLLLLALLLVALYVTFALQVRKTTYELHQLTVPDMCHAQSDGEMIVHFDNPSFCSPQIGDIELVISKNATNLFRLSLPGFYLQSGKSTVVTTIGFALLASPEVIHDLVFLREGSLQVAGKVVVRISCLLIPFTITRDLSDLTTHEKQAVANANPDTNSARSVDGGMISKELDRLVNQILKTIALSNIHTESDKNELFAFTDVQFSYTSSVLWNLPSLALRLQTETQQTILKAGFKRFLLGNGPTFISAFSEIYKNETAPMQDMLQTYLSGKDLNLHVTGSNADSPCLSLQLLDLLDVRVHVPAKIDGKPALLRYYSVQPVLKELNSKTHTCKLELDVVLTLHNPLPIQLELHALRFDLFYRNRNQSLATPRLLAHVDDRSGVLWHAHDVHNISLSTEVHEYDICKNVLDVYLKDELAFSLHDGSIHMSAGNGDFTIPFHVPEIPIHPEILTQS